MGGSSSAALDAGSSQAERIARFAHDTLAQKCRLRGDATRLVCSPIRRGGEVCGLHFALRGPRDVLLTAVWDASTNTLWCYDSRGERFLQTTPE